MFYVEEEILVALRIIHQWENRRHMKLAEKQFMKYLNLSCSPNQPGRTHYLIYLQLSFHKIPRPDLRSKAIRLSDVPVCQHKVESLNL